MPVFELFHDHVMRGMNIKLFPFEFPTGKIARAAKCS